MAVSLIWRCLSRMALTASQVDIGRGEVVEALVAAVAIVVVDEGCDGPHPEGSRFRAECAIARSCLCHGMIGLAAHVTHALLHSATQTLHRRRRHKPGGDVSNSADKAFRTVQSPAGSSWPRPPPR